eukprot:gene19779-6927_t
MGQKTEPSSSGDATTKDAAKNGLRKWNAWFESIRKLNGLQQVGSMAVALLVAVMSLTDSSIHSDTLWTALRIVLVLGTLAE